MSLDVVGEEILWDSLSTMFNKVTKSMYFKNASALAFVLRTAPPRKLT